MVLHVVAYRVADGGVGLAEEFAEADEKAAHMVCQWVGVSV